MDAIALVCPNCGRHSGRALRFCRACGMDHTLTAEALAGTFGPAVRDDISGADRMVDDGRAGRKASLTNEGKSVDFCASGYAVESSVPGSDCMTNSGTSTHPMIPGASTVRQRVHQNHPNVLMFEAFCPICTSAWCLATDRRLSLDLQGYVCPEGGVSDPRPRSDSP